MYYYVYDSKALAKDSQRVLTKIETQINNLGLSGERGQVSTLKSVEDLVTEAARKKYKPIVAVGEDATFNAALNALAELNSDVPLGYIPLDEKQPMAQLLGLDLSNAVVSLSRRIIRDVPLASAGKAYFVSFVRLVMPEVPSKEKVNLLERLFKKKPNRFTATFTLDQVIKGSVDASSVTVHFSPNEERLRVEVVGAKQQAKKASKDLSVMWSEHVQIEGTPQLACLIDGRPVTRTPLDVTISPIKMPLIVGRSRSFA